MGHNSRKMQRPLAGRTTWPALNLPANRMSPATRGAKGHRALLVDGEPPHWEIFSPRTAFTNTSGMSRSASRPLRPSPGPSIACPLPNKPKPKPHNRRCCKWNTRLGRVRRRRGTSAVLKVRLWRRGSASGGQNKSSLSASHSPLNPPGNTPSPGA